MPLTAAIDSAIPQQNFEFIRDRIGEILLVEFANQKQNFGLAAELCPTEVGIERFVDVDDQEFPIINVRLFKGKYTDDEGMPTKDSSGQRAGTNTYVIDIVTGSPSDGNTPADEKASVNLHRMMGIVQAILEDTRYSTLGFDSNDMCIRSTHIDSYIINIPGNTINTADMIWGKTFFEVTVVEEVALPQPRPLEIATVTATLRNSTRGLYWTFEQAKINITGSGATLADEFFSNQVNTIDLLDNNGNVSATYTLNTDYTQDEATQTITATTFTFTSGTSIIAKTS